MAKKLEMSEEEKTHAQLIEEIIGRKLKPIYWAVGIMVVIFLGVSGPLTNQVISNSVTIGEDISSEEAYKNFLLKGAYHLLQKDEHEADIDAIRNPSNADIIYMKHNSSEAERLDIVQRGAEKFYKNDYNKAKKQ